MPSPKIILQLSAPLPPTRTWLQGRDRRHRNTGRLPGRARPAVWAVRHKRRVVRGRENHHARYSWQQVHRRAACHCEAPPVGSMHPRRADDTSTPRGGFQRCCGGTWEVERLLGAGLALRGMRWIQVVGPLWFPVGASTLGYAAVSPLAVVMGVATDVWGGRAELGA